MQCERLNGLIAGVSSTLLIVLFGEIFPQAIFSRQALKFTARFTPLLRLMIVVTYPVTKPLQLLLDKLLGDEHTKIQSRRELGDSERIRFCLGWVAVLAAGRRDFEAAVAALESDVDVTRAMGSVDGEIQLLDDAAIVAFHADQPAWSLRLAAGARARKESSWVESPYWAMRMAEVVAGSRNKLPVAEADKAWAEGGTLTLEAGMTAAEAMLREVDRLRVSRRHKKGALSSREVEVARLIGLGFTSRELATRLFISERTAEGHVQHILNKLGLVNRSQIAAWVTENRPAASPV